MFAPLLALSLLAAPAAKPATNTVCPVLGGKVTPGKSPKVAVRGQDYYLCCAGCDTKLLQDPDKYLQKDGTPKNAKK
jgi:YHS domain-containing protein